ncbi:PadR family transcriptional regulator [Paenibacillus campi]|uniref:PadR family transcriptional regulator n=1 Tax=Paenibacillus campi TaxID=3106031 RepID=UPI002AFF5A0B|nr:PadR family transcriptional regulator [Paenibacillus sp. SGZ-1009]
MSLQIYILGSLWERDIHPYEIKKRITENTGGTVNITDGNLYYNFDSLHKKGYIEKIEVVQSDNYPDKSFYRITDKGRTGLRNMIYKSFAKPSDVKSLMAPLLFLQLVDRKRIVFLLQEAIEQREVELTTMQQRIVEGAASSNETEEQQLYAFIVRYSLSRREHELAALKEMLGVVEQMHNGQSS